MQEYFKNIWFSLIFLSLITNLTFSETIMDRKKFSKAECTLFERDMETLRTKYVEEMCKKYSLECDGVGGGCVYNINLIFVSFNSQKNYNLDEARKLYIDCCEELLKRINADEKIRPYLSHYPYTNEGIRINLSFLQKNGDRVSSKYIAFVSLAHGTVYYDIYNKQQEALKEVYKESYSEALKKANSERNSKEEDKITKIPV